MSLQFGCVRWKLRSRQLFVSAPTVLGVASAQFDDHLLSCNYAPGPLNNAALQISTLSGVKAIWDRRDRRRVCMWARVRTLVIDVCSHVAFDDASNCRATRRVKRTHIFPIDFHQCCIRANGRSRYVL